MQRGAASESNTIALDSARVHGSSQHAEVQTAGTGGNGNYLRCTDRSVADRQAVGGAFTHSFLT